MKFSISLPVVLVPFFVMSCYRGVVTEGFVVTPPVVTKQVVLATTNHHILGVSTTKLWSTTANNQNKNPKQKADTNNKNASGGSDTFSFIQRSIPLDDANSKKEDKDDDDDEVVLYDIGVSGTTFQTGELSQKFMNAIASKLQLNLDTDNDSLTLSVQQLVFQLTTQEAIKAVLKQNGMELAIEKNNKNDNNNNDEGTDVWGLSVDTIRFMNNNNNHQNHENNDDNTTQEFATLTDALENLSRHWNPGQSFDFIVRQVPARMKQLSLQELMAALDPDGTYRQQAEQKGIELPDDNEMMIYEDDETLTSIVEHNAFRTEQSPRGAVVEEEAYAGTEKAGYNVIKATDLIRPNSNDGDGSENMKIVMHVMDAFVNHGCIIVDLSNSENNEPAIMTRMWNTAEAFFDKLEKKKDSVSQLPAMQTAKGTGSTFAKVGFASYNDGNLKFLETRQTRQGQLQPANVLDNDNDDNASQSLMDAFQVVAKIGQNLVRIAVAASTEEAGALEGPEASAAAHLLATELVDDGKSLPSDCSISYNAEEPISMSPHRLCSYSNNNNNNNNKKDANSSPAAEVFGAHTDSTFVTAVPVAEVSGLEVYDEAAEQWYRPELKAKQHYFKNYHNDDDSHNNEQQKWHARYVVFMPGELLQIATRNEVLATVHRVVVADKQHGASRRLSAPILLRGRPGTKLDCDRYLGGTVGSSLLQQCNGMTIEDIHDAMQPKTKK